MVRPFYFQYDVVYGCCFGEVESVIKRLRCIELLSSMIINEPHREKTGLLPMRKQRRRSALR